MLFKVFEQKVLNNYKREMSDCCTDGSRVNELRFTHISWNLNEEFHSYRPMLAGLTLYMANIDFVNKKEIYDSLKNESLKY